MFSGLLTFAAINVFFSLAFLFILFLLRLLLRNQWAAAAAFLLLFVGLGSLGFVESPMLFALLGAIQYGLILFVMMRFGLAALVTASFSYGALLALPLTVQTSAWYAGIGLSGLLVLLAIALYGFYTSLGGRPAFGGAALDE